ncbi:MAG: hypothetical protein TREMPRED_003298 [Tremellales sp. Tagirdzhanova-0007]|nr:MAG: hypothetical protein TREMPRED_003298 [Tremellales sp. Tagirdzhanova-0007]
MSTHSDSRDSRKLGYRPGVTTPVFGEIDENPLVPLTGERSKASRKTTPLIYHDSEPLLRTTASFEDTSQGAFDVIVGDSISRGHKGKGKLSRSRVYPQGEKKGERPTPSQTQDLSGSFHMDRSLQTSLGEILRDTLIKFEGLNRSFCDLQSNSSKSEGILDRLHPPLIRLNSMLNLTSKELSSIKTAINDAIETVQSLEEVQGHKSTVSKKVQKLSADLQTIHSGSLAIERSHNETSSLVKKIRVTIFGETKGKEEEEEEEESGGEEEKK